jgi:hypothetical protein
MQFNPPPHAERLKSSGMVAAVFGLAMACYWPALHGGFIWNDADHVWPARRCVH